MVHLLGDGVFAFFDFFRDAKLYANELRAQGYTGKLIACNDVGIVCEY